LRVAPTEELNRLFVYFLILIRSYKATNHKKSSRFVSVSMFIEIAIVAVYNNWFEDILSGLTT
jgi:hypothetical protein